MRNKRARPITRKRKEFFVGIETYLQLVSSAEKVDTQMISHYCQWME